MGAHPSQQRRLLVLLLLPSSSSSPSSASPQKRQPPQKACCVMLFRCLVSSLGHAKYPIRTFYNCAVACVWIFIFIFFFFSSSSSSSLRQLKVSSRHHELASIKDTKYTITLDTSYCPHLISLFTLKRYLIYQ